MNNQSAPVNDQGFTWRGRLDTNQADPVEVWACPTCHALVQTADHDAHMRWHAEDDTRAATAPQDACRLCGGSFADHQRRGFTCPETTEDQWAMQDHAEEVRRWLAEPSPKLGLTMERLHGVLGQVDRLRAAGDAVADAAREAVNRPGARGVRAQLDTTERAWRSVRGDAPEGASLHCPRCGGGIVVEVDTNDDGYGIRDIRMECDRPSCGAVWGSCGDPR